jgi:hypothetical protein
MTEKKRARTATASLWSIRFHKPPKSPSSIIISLAQNLKHCPVRGSKMVPTRLARTLNKANELNAL